MDTDRYGELCPYGALYPAPLARPFSKGLLHKGEFLDPQPLVTSHQSPNFKYHGDAALELRVPGGKRGRFFGIRC